MGKPFFKKVFPTYLMMTLFDTIAAISTPMGKGGVALIRLSGPDAMTIAQKVFAPKDGKPLSQHPPRMAVYGGIYAPDEPDFMLDDGLCTLFPTPHSFTGEDTVEIACHGGILVTQSVLSACLMAGARQALPGEFTKRAYLNGKMRLPEAEALGNLLEAGNREQLKLARAGMAGHLAKEMELAYSRILSVLANMEAGMDFPEEDLSEMPREDMMSELSAVRDHLQRLCSTYRTGHAIAEGIPTVIVGRPNVGKSALYNALVGRDAAIVTDIAGTTRDVLSETVTLGRVTLRLSDTAGLRETDDVVEQMGVERAKSALQEAELVLALFDGSNAPTAEDIELLETLSTQAKNGKNVLYILTKQDLTQPNHIPFFTPDVTAFGLGYIPLSTKLDKSGWDDDALTVTETLTAVVEQLFIDGSLDTGASAIIFNARQYATLCTATSALESTLNALTMELPMDICAEDLRSALTILGDLSGHSIREEVISEIFSKFCIGK